MSQGRSLPTTSETASLRTVRLTLCESCISGEGGECHTPGCTLWMKCAPDVPLDPDDLGSPTSLTALAPFIDESDMVVLVKPVGGAMVFRPTDEEGVIERVAHRVEISYGYDKSKTKRHVSKLVVKAEPPTAKGVDT